MNFSPRTHDESSAQQRQEFDKSQTSTESADLTQHSFSSKWKSSQLAKLGAMGLSLGAALQAQGQSADPEPVEAPKTSVVTLVKDAGEKPPEQEAETKMAHFIEVETQEQLDQVIKTAKAEDKSVMIDFYTTWCAPCKILDAETFRAPKVINWLKENTVSVKVDAEKNPFTEKLKEDRKVQSFPTLLFLDGEGKELGRFTGFKDKDEFITHGEEALGARDPIKRAYAEVARGENRYHSVPIVANHMIEQGELEEAFQFCMDEFGPRVHKPLRKLAELGIPVDDRLHGEREGIAQCFREGVVDKDSINRIYWLDLYFDRSKKAYLELHDELRDTEPPVLEVDSGIPVVDMMRQQWSVIFIRNDRFSDLAGVDLSEGIDTCLRNLEGYFDPDNENFEKSETAKMNLWVPAFTYPLTGYYKVAAALEDQAQQDFIIGEWESVVPEKYRTAKLYNSFAWDAYESGVATRDHLELAEKALELGGDHSAAVIDTVARIAAQVGEKGRATELVDVALDRFAQIDDAMVRFEAAVSADTPDTSAAREALASAMSVKFRGETGEEVSHPEVEKISKLLKKELESDDTEFPTATFKKASEKTVKKLSSSREVLEKCAEEMEPQL